MKKIFLSIIGIFLSEFVVCQDVTGSWRGVLDVGMAKLPLVVHISESDGKLLATMDSPSQGAMGIAVNTVVFEDLKLRFAITALGAKYEGMLRNDSVFGTFTQSGMIFPLNFARTNSPKGKPQDPKPLFPYLIENVQFSNKKANISLAGTFTLPKDGNALTAVVLVSGSGPQNRDEEVFGHRPFAVLADYLTRRGIAVLRYDDRGVGASSGDYKTATIVDFTDDAAAAIAYLKTRKEVNPAKIGVIGHSEGGTIAFLLAGKSGENSSDLAFIVSLAGMAIPGDSLLQMQRYLLAKAANVSDAQIAQNEELIRVIDSVVQTHSNEFILQNLDEIIDDLLPDAQKDNDVLKFAFRKGFEQLMSVEIRSLMRCNPAEALQNIRCPVFALNGERDMQVPADANLERIRLLVKSPLLIKKYLKINHLFQSCDTCLPTEYGIIEETISEEVLGDVAEWVGAR